MKFAVLAAACGALLIPSVGSAAADPAGATAAPAPASAASAQPAAKPKKEKKVCKQIGETGSRLGAKAVCKTAEEWEAESAAQRRQSDVDMRPR